MLIELDVHDREHPQVVQAGEDTFLCDFQAACHHGELEEVVALQCPAVQVLD